ncbi:MAG: hypothetical protein HYX74_00610 [Acidobacteria bacterium]|nr:hypothetical protein [Acidobacteriota bacterium]
MKLSESSTASGKVAVMKHKLCSRAVSAALFWAVMGGLAGWGFYLILPTGVAPVADSRARSNPSGAARLIAYETLPEMMECAWTPETSGLAAALWQQEPFERRTGESASARGIAPEPPLRVIRDSYPAFSAVAVDVTHDEVIVTDENLFQILVYDRLAHTPPRAAMTEPKRVIAGLNTKVEFQCGLYVDPGNGDIYAVNNDTIRTLVIYSRRAEGNVPPDRELATPQGTFGIAVDEAKNELFLTVQHDNAVVVFRKQASGEEPPVRLIQGEQTRLADPHGMALDPQKGLIFVANHGSVRRTRLPDPAARLKVNWPLGQAMVVPGSGRFTPPSITVYRSDASGDVPPLRVIEGPRTQLNYPTGMVLDVERGELYVANDMLNSVLVFSATAHGDVAPLRELKGPRTGIRSPTGLFLDTTHDELWVTNFGNHTVTVYRRGAGGDTPPLRTIRSAPPDKPSLMIGNPGAVDYDTKRKEILVPN